MQAKSLLYWSGSKVFAILRGSGAGLSLKVMRTFLFLACATLVAAQTQHTVITRELDTPDAYGNPIAHPETTYTKWDGDTQVVERRQNINGRLITVEREEQRVVSDRGGVKVIERAVRRYDLNGEPLPPEKQVITEAKRPDGSTSLEQVVWRGDISGNMAVAERVTTETQKNGSNTTSSSVIARPTINGSMDVVEKRETVKVENSPNAFESTETILRNGQNGLYEAVRLVTSHNEQHGKSSENTGEYEIGPSGTLELHSQIVTTAAKAADGSETSQTSYFERRGGFEITDSAMQLRAQETSQRVPGPNHSATETVSVRYPSPSDVNVLGPAKTISETVCRGECIEKK